MNRLAAETSPYLRQHKDNPVDWYAWGDEAFARARAEDRPILLSVGYSACHWCHVMAHECFEDAEVAARMNELFVNVKVDREERPDVDSVYMDAVQAISGRGGWPMTMFLTPDGAPFFGGTYYPKPSFLQLMTAVDEAWHGRRDELLGQAGQLTEIVGRTARIEPGAQVPCLDELNLALQQLGQRFDAAWGGFGEAPKFPSTMSLELLLRIHVANGDVEMLDAVTVTLDAMAAGGIYDHIGGGFSRYSVDERWLVPHFEKMLYDEALLARIYLHAHLVTGNESWRQVATETIDYVLRDLGQPEGGFSSAEDADSPDEHGHGHEGLFYIWTPALVAAALVADADTGDQDPHDIDAVLAWYGIADPGNFEGRSIANRMHARGVLVRPEAIERARARLFTVRAGRPRPGLDDKVLTEWNALMLTTLAEAAAALDRPDWMAAAVANAEFLCRELRDNTTGHWRRSWQRDGGARHDALAADHAALLQAFLAMAAATGQARWIGEAGLVADALLDRFWDPERGGVFTNALDGAALIARQKDLMDNATPSANSMAAVGLLRLAALTGERRYREHADQILRLVSDMVRQAPSAFSELFTAVDLRRTGTTEIVITGDRPDLVREVHRRHLPHAVVAWGERFDSPLWQARPGGLAFVCQDYACLTPVGTVDELRSLLDARPDGGPRDDAGPDGPSRAAE